MRKKKILWADDEIEILRAYLLFLEKENYDVTTVSNGADAIDAFNNDNYDLVILDEHMPGVNGLDALSQMKQMRPETPVVMMTKSEDNEIMQSAWGKLVDDYLVKPVSIPQMKASLTRIFQRKDLIREETQKQFLSEYGRISMQISDCNSWAEWANLYKTIVNWELRLEDNDGIADTLLSLKHDANTSFAKFVNSHYLTWVKEGTQAGGPLLSHRILSDVIKPLLLNNEKVALIVIDNFRLDQWEVIRPSLVENFNIQTELYSGILPTATQYARNAIFSGLMPADIKKIVPHLWVDEADNEDTLNANERELLANYFERQRMNVRNAYYKVNFSESGENLIKKFRGYENNHLNALVYNFVDMLSHACTENKTIKELIPDDAAYRRITRQWFATGTLQRMLEILRQKKFKIILTTDHGTIRVSKPVEAKGLKDMNTNLRFKTGKNMGYDPKEVVEIAKPAEARLPEMAPGAPYIFAPSDKFFVYPNNRNEYIQKFSDSFQHGGISMEEMILPLITLSSK